jgi:hypothetical protein
VKWEHTRNPVRTRASVEPSARPRKARPPDQACARMAEGVWTVELSGFPRGIAQEEGFSTCLRRPGARRCAANIGQSWRSVQRQGSRDHVGRFLASSGAALKHHHPRDRLCRAFIRERFLGSDSDGRRGHCHGQPGEPFAKGAMSRLAFPSGAPARCSHASMDRTQRGWRGVQRTTTVARMRPARPGGEAERAAGQNRRVAAKT